MKKSELKQRYKQYLQEMPYRVKVIAGRHLPELPRCSNFVEFSDRTITLTFMPISVSRGEHESYWVARDALYQLIYGYVKPAETEFIQEHQYDAHPQYQIEYAKFRDALYSKYYDKIVKAYIALLKEEAKLGCVRVPAKYKPINVNDKQVTDCGDKPMLTEVSAPSFDVFTSTAMLFATAILKNTPCSALSVHLNHAVDKQDYIAVQSIVRRFCQDVNQYLLAKYEQT